MISEMDKCSHQTGAAKLETNEQAHTFGMCRAQNTNIK